MFPRVAASRDDGCYVLSRLRRGSAGIRILENQKCYSDLIEKPLYGFSKSPDDLGTSIEYRCGPRVRSFISFPHIVVGVVRL